MSDRLTEIRARLDAATPGPWTSNDYLVVVTEAARNHPIIGAYSKHIAQARNEENADLIAHAPADIEWLLDEVDNLNKTLNEWMTFCGSKECGLQRKAGAK